MPAPQSTLTFDFLAEGLRRKEEQRQAREDAMRNALEILATAYPSDYPTPRSFGTMVRATAREGLGRD